MKRICLKDNHPEIKLKRPIQQKEVLAAYLSAAVLPSFSSDYFL